MIKIYSLSYENSERYMYDPMYSYISCNTIREGIEKVFEDNSDNDVIGILTNGYYFVRQEQPLNEYAVENGLKNCDLILPYEEFLSDKTVMEYCAENLELFGGIEMLRQYIRDKFPELSYSYEWVLESKSYLCGNNVIGKASLIKKAYSMAFMIPEIVENSYLMGLFLKIWIHSEGLKFYSTCINKNNVESWNSGCKKIELVRNYISILLNDYVDLRKAQGFAEDFAGENPYLGDFDGKHPIWICWWQGEEQLPALIKGCINSLRRNAPDNSQIILVTLDNVNQYATFTPEVIEKFEKGIISYTHLSDILRAELLFRYGGMWIDATYYVSHPIPNDLLEENLFSIAFEKPLWGMDVMQGRWTLSLIVAQRHNPAMQFLMEGLWLYWEKSNELVDYFTVDYVFDLGYNSFETIKDLVELIPKSPAAVYDLQLKMNQRIDYRDIEWLEKASLFYKLNRRNEYSSCIFTGEKTFYGYLIEYDDKKNNDDIVLYCDNYGSLINYLRLLNVKKILDYDNYLCSRGELSRGIVADILCKDLIIDGTSNRNLMRKTNSNTEDGMCGLYDSVYAKDSVVEGEILEHILGMLDEAQCGTNIVMCRDYSDYDAIIIEKTDIDEYDMNGDYFKADDVQKLQNTAARFKHRINNLLKIGNAGAYAKCCELISGKDAEPLFQVDKELMNFRILAVAEKAQLEKHKYPTLFEGRSLSSLEHLYQEIVFRLRRIEFGIDIDVKKDIISFLVNEQIDVDVLMVVLQGTTYLYSKDRIMQEIARGIS